MAGAISYAFYVFHLPSINFVHFLFEKYERTHAHLYGANFIVSFMLCLVLSLLSYRLMEMPLARMKHKIIPRLLKSPGRPVAGVEVPVPVHANTGR